jgi:hypothetical protein
MPGSLGSLAKAQIASRLGPHPGNPKYAAAYTAASQHIAKWLAGKMTPRQLCEAINRGENAVLEALNALSQQTLEIARFLADNPMEEGDYEQILRRIDHHNRKTIVVGGREISHNPHYLVLASVEVPMGSDQVRCPYCKGGHHDWTLTQMAAMRLLILQHAEEMRQRAADNGAGEG